MVAMAMKKDKLLKAQNQLNARYMVVEGGILRIGIRGRQQSI